MSTAEVTSASTSCVSDGTEPKYHLKMVIVADQADELASGYPAVGDLNLATCLCRLEHLGEPLGHAPRPALVEDFCQSREAQSLCHHGPIDAKVSTARSSAYVSKSLPFHGWLERPWPRPSCAMQRYPRDARKNI
jgi:hypothetical protein